MRSRVVLKQDQSTPESRFSFLKRFEELVGMNWLAFTQQAETMSTYHMVHHELGEWELLSRAGEATMWTLSKKESKDV